MEAVRPETGATSVAQNTFEKQPLIDIDGYLQELDAGSYGVYASLGIRYKYAIFGRDSIEIAEDLLPTHKDLAHTVIHALARLQGCTTNDITEEQPGRIHHEYRAVSFDNVPAPASSIALMHELQRDWGDNVKDSMTYYGSVDATPLYIRLIYHFTALYGDDILTETYTSKEGKDRTIADSVYSAVGWIALGIQQSEWDLLEYKRANPRGIENQVWKDSPSAYLHRDGTAANFTDGIASIEVQGYAYDALLAAANMVGTKAERNQWRKMAQHIQDTTIARMWMEDEQFFAQGLDRDHKGITRAIGTLTSNAGLLLDSRLLHDLPETTRRRYVEPTVAQLCGPQFMTAAGLRSRAHKHHNLVGYIDYHDSSTTWPKETYDIARGLRRHDYADEAWILESAILNSIVRAGQFSELFYVNPDNEVWYHSSDALTHFAKDTAHKLPPNPEPNQGWTISAAKAIQHRREVSDSKRFASTSSVRV